MVADGFGPETVRFLEGGASLIVGTVNAGNEPHVSRGWGIFVLQDDPPRIRLVLDAFDEVLLDNLAAGGAIAITGTDVPSLESVQVKGRSTGIQPATVEDREKAVRFCDAFFGDVIRTDGTARALLDRLVPAGFVATEIEVDELFNQTPGPGAGAAISTKS